MIIVATGHDGPGKMSAITRAVYHTGKGSVSESKMVKMGGHFICVMVVSLDNVNKTALEKACTTKSATLKCRCGGRLTFLSIVQSPQSINEWTNRT